MEFGEILMLNLNFIFFWFLLDVGKEVWEYWELFMFFVMWSSPLSLPSCAAFHDLIDKQDEATHGHQSRQFFRKTFASANSTY